MNEKRDSNRGVALILVLLMISLIVAVTIQLNRSTRGEIYGAANLSDGIRLRAVAQSGFQAGESVLLTDKNNFDALTETWANSELLTLRFEPLFERASFKLLIEDEGGKIAVNRLVANGAFNAPVRELLLRLLTGPDFGLAQGKAEELLEAIKDWIDADGDVTGSGAEGAYYAGLSRPYAVKNAPLDCIEELLMVKGITPELFYGMGKSPGLAQCLTVFGEGKLNINTAPLPVLQALAAEMTPELAASLDEYRREARNDLADPLWYQKIPGTAGLHFPQALLVARSEIFRITAVGLQGSMTERVTGVVQRDGDRKKIKLLAWKVG
ncbi:MAG: type II secretion system minor pseudopilin GspK [Deltaproteobacteria bacterium]|nr:type II secretion system minor pseudopilin GspK [Deltaproteobacteria bacterium]